MHAIDARTATIGFRIYGLAVDAAGRVYYSANDYHRLGRVGTDGVLAFVAGNGMEGIAGDYLPASPASTRLAYPGAIAFDAAGHLLLVDRGNNSLRIIW